MVNITDMNRRFFDNATAGIIQTTPAGRCLKVNPALARMHGYESPEEMMASVADVREQLFVNVEDYKSFTEVLEKRDSIIIP